MSISHAEWAAAISRRHIETLRHDLAAAQAGERAAVAAVYEAARTVNAAMGALRGSVAVCSPGVARGDLDQKRGAEGRTETMGEK